MIRDFSKNAKDELYQQIDQVTPQGFWEGLTDCVGDWGYHLQSWLGFLRVDRYLNNIKDYHRKILDKNDTSKEEIDKIFEEVAYIDHKYCKPLEFLRGELEDCGQYTNTLARIIQPGNRMFTKELCANIKLQIQKSGIKQSLDDLEKDINASGVNVNSMDKDKMLEYIVLYEMIYPEYAGKIDQLLQTDDVLTKEDRTKMKYLAYTAEEPYKTVYFKYIDEYQLGSIGDKNVNTCYYSPNNNKIFFTDNINPFSGDNRGPYTTWFHESGHATDSNAASNGGYYCQEYKMYLAYFGREVTLQEAIYADVYDDIRNVIQGYAAAASDTIRVETVLDTFRYGVEEPSLTDAEKLVRDQVVAYYDTDLAGAVNEAACDVYGGVTNLEIGRNRGFGHRPSKRDENGNILTDEEYQEAIDNYTYWYNSKGEETFAQSRELVAEYFSYHMTGNTAALSSLRDHFPQAVQVLDQMFVEMAKEN